MYVLSIYLLQLLLPQPRPLQVQVDLSICQIQVFTSGYVCMYVSEYAS